MPPGKQAHLAIRRGDRAVPNIPQVPNPSTVAVGGDSSTQPYLKYILSLRDGAAALQRVASHLMPPPSSGAIDG